MRRYIKKHNMKVFFIVTFLFSWTFWLLSDFLNLTLLKTIGTFGPVLAAAAVTYISEGNKGIKCLFNKFTIWKLNAGWYIFSLTITAIVVFAALCIYRLSGGSGLVYNDPSEWYMIFPIFLYVLFFSVLGEETGWRGFAQEKLQIKMGVIPAGLIIGVIWGMWHMPLFLMNGDFHNTIPFWVFMVQEIALSVIMAWIYWRTKGSLIVVHLLHAASNVTVGILPILPQDASGSLIPLYVTVGLLVIFSISLVIIEWKKPNMTGTAISVKREIYE